MSARGAGRLVQPSVLAANMAGLAVSVYLTFVHFAAATLVCTVGGAVNCERVLGSNYAVIAGSQVPTSAAGIVWFGVGALLAAAMWRLPRTATVARAQMAWSSIGLITVLYLVFIEIVQIGAICLWCSAAHILVVAIFLLTVTIRPAQS